MPRKRTKKRTSLLARLLSHDQSFDDQSFDVFGHKNLDPSVETFDEVYF